MSKILRGVMVYAFLILGIGLIAGMILVGTMFITSSFGKPLTVFGYNAVYIARTGQEDKKVTVVDHDIEIPIKVNINAQSYKLNIVQKSDSYKEVIIKRSDNIFGFYKNELNLNTEVSFENSVLTINIANNEGLMSYNKSFVTIYLPKDYSYNLNLKTQAGNIEIDGNNQTKFNINELVAETNTGDLMLENILPASSSESVVKFNKLQFKTNKGEFDLSNISTIELNNPSDENKINLQSKRGDFIFNNINAPVIISGTDVRIIANEINTLNFGFNFDSPSGYFSIKKIITGTVSTGSDEGNPEPETIPYKNIINTTATHIVIDEIVGETSISTIHGDIKIGVLHSPTAITSVEGDIEINNAKKYINIVNQMGKISVKAYEEGAFIKNNKGTITATYSGEKDASKITTLDAEIQTVSGGVTLNNIYNKLTLLVTNANVTVDFQQLPEINFEHQLTNTQGVTTIKVNANVGFYINSTGNVAGKVATHVINSQTTSVLGGTQNGSVVFKLTTSNGKFTFADKT